MAVVVVEPRGGKPTRNGYGDGLLEAGRRNPNVVALDADLAGSTRSQWFGDEFPDRFYQMGISEQDMVLTAAGLAACGKVAFASTFAIFGERAFEQVRNGVCRPNLNVKIVGSHGGLMTGEDGASAHAIEDVAIYRALPNMRVVVPADAKEAEKAAIALAESHGPAYLKLTRAKVPELFDDSYDFQLGKSVTLREGDDAAILACGALVGESLKAHDILQEEGISARVVNVSTIKPLDVEAVVEAAGTGAVVTAEDHNVVGGLGSAVAETMSERAPAILRRVGVQDTFAESGKPHELYEKYGLTAEAVVNAVRDAVKAK